MRSTTNEKCLILHIYECNCVCGRVLIFRLRRICLLLAWLVGRMCATIYYAIDEIVVFFLIVEVVR